MNKVGFAVFGRPTAQEVKANGLFMDVRLADRLYLSGLTGDVLLEKGQSVGIVQRIDVAGTPTIWLVAIFEYAESFGDMNRPGGFIGTAVCFQGIPQTELLQSLLFRIHGSMLREIDGSTRKFLTPRKEQWRVELPEVYDKYVSSAPNVFSQLQSNSRISISSPGQLQFFLPSVVHGVISNPSFNSQQTVLVSADTAFLEKVQQRGVRQFSLYQLLDYSMAHKHHSEIIETKKKEIESQKVELKQLTDARQNLTSDTDKLKLDWGNASQRVAEIEVSLVKLLGDEKQIKGRIDALRIEERRLNDAKDANRRLSFQKEILNGPYKSDIDRYVQEKINTLDSERRRYNERFIKIKKKSLVAVLIGSLAVILVFVVAVITLNHLKLQPFNPSKQRTETVKQQGQKQETKSPSVNKPKEIPLNDPQDMEFWEQQRSDVGAYLKELEARQSDGTLSKADLLAALQRKWNLRELFPSENVKDISQSVEPVFFLEKFYQNTGSMKNGWAFSKISIIPDFQSQELDSIQNVTVSERLRNQFFLIPAEAQKVEVKSHDFKTSKNMDILKRYLELPDNIYREGNVFYNVNEPDSILWLHFRWMVSRLSKHADEKDRDIVTTTKTSHVVPICKKQ